MASLKASSLAPNAPSPTPSNTSANGTKRKRPEGSGGVVFSQPKDTAMRNHEMTQLTYAIEHLQEKPDMWFTFKEIMDYLNINTNDGLCKRLKTYFDHNNPSSKIEYDPATKKYRYKPKYNIRNNAELRQYLQNQKSAQGLSVKDLKDGWPTVQDDLRILEQRKQILVRHNTKDMNARTVWDNDPTLMHVVDPEFKNEWHQIMIPAGQDDLRKTLLAAGLKPSSAPRVATTSKPKETKRKSARRGGKQTNTHMGGILKDFSHLRRK
ncbi:transcription initiation factor IIE, beta subunit [Bimuria novae-zelandiae CBS 107.79]|uniref:Transcription initiation factor IIE subunit beta n=1 Tax=Bimuria novae-zelandiae CBS 107.79 TaxID=1447943 RepID=A0A6A5UWF1_9PLEO|nr:transcription initiation factor IIE, beta subunit [Bimuria novae-zelandiae CBS 107.79]